MDEQKVRLVIGALEAGIQILKDELFPEPMTTIIHIEAGGDINGAIKSLKDTGGEIVLAVGDYKTNIVLEKRDITKMIVIRGPLFDGLRRAIKTDAVNMPRIASATLEPTVKALPNSGGIIFRNVAFTAIAPDRTMVDLGDDSRTLKLPTQRAANFGFDSCLFLGSETKGQHRGIQCNALNVSVVSCGFYDLFEFGRDSQALCGWNGTENIHLYNSYFEAGAENVMFGGSDSASPEMIPKNISVEGCHFSKNYDWLKVPNGGTINIKALFELKNVDGFSMNGCLFEHCWAKNWSSGVGMTLKSCNQENEPWATLKNVIVQNCVIRDVGSPFNVIGQNDSGKPSVRGDNVTIRNILAYRINQGVYRGDGRAFLVINAPYNFSVQNCTILGAEHSMMSLTQEFEKSPGFRFEKNVIHHGEYGVFTSFGLGSAGLFNQFTNPVFENNKIRRNDVRQNVLPPSNTIVPIADFDAMLLPNMEWNDKTYGVNIAALKSAMMDQY